MGSGGSSTTGAGSGAGAGKGSGAGGMTTVTGAGSGSSMAAVCASGARIGVGAGAGAMDTDGASSGRRTAGAMYGGSTSALNSRTRLPRPQLASIRKVRKGSVKRAGVVTRTTGWPAAFRPTLICRLAVMPTGRSSPTRAKASGEASRTSSSSSSPGAADRIGISATSGSLSPDLTWIWPRPSAWALDAPNASARARGSCRCLMFTLESPRRSLA